jgi:hypothetical protein
MLGAGKAFLSILVLVAAPLLAETVKTPARTLKLHDDNLGYLATVPTTGWGESIEVLKDDRNGDRQYLLIAYPGSADFPGGAYWVRRSALMPQLVCTQTPVRAREGDNRGGGNGAGTFCEPAK